MKHNVRFLKDDWWACAPKQFKLMQHAIVDKYTQIQERDSLGSEVDLVVIAEKIVINGATG